LHDSIETLYTINEYTVYSPKARYFDSYGRKRKKKKKNRVWELFERITVPFWTSLLTVKRN